MSYLLQRHRLRALSLAMVTLVVVASSEDAAARDSLYRRVVQSTVWITTEFGLGTGAVVDRDGKPAILTNYHVVAESEDVQICFPVIEEGSLVAEASYYYERIDELSVPGNVVAVDARRDLALIELDAFPEQVKSLTLAAASPDPGDQVHSVGNPGASDALWVYASGTVRSVYRKTIAFSADWKVEARMIETDSPLNPGDSGGPLVNAQGELVGVIQSGLVEAQGMSICIDVSEVRSFLAGEITPMVDKRIRSLLDGLGIQYDVDALGLYSVTQPVEYSLAPIPLYIRSQTTALGEEERRVVFTEMAVDPQTASYLVPYLLRPTDEGFWTMEVIADTACIVSFNVRISADSSQESLAAAMAEVTAGYQLLAEVRRRAALFASR